MLLIGALLQLFGHGLKEGDQQTEGLTTTLELGALLLIIQQLDDLGKAGLLLSKEAISGGRALLLLKTQWIISVETTRLYLLPPLLQLLLNGGFLDEGARETEIVFSILIDGLDDAQQAGLSEEGLMLGIEVGQRLLQCQRHIAASHRTLLGEDGGFLTPTVEATEEVGKLHTFGEEGFELFLHLTIIKGVTYLGGFLVGNLDVWILGDVGECQSGIAQAIDELVIALDLIEATFETGKLATEDAYLLLFQKIAVGLAKHHHILLDKGKIILEETYLILGNDDGALIDIGVELAAHSGIGEPLLQPGQGGLHEDQAWNDGSLDHLRLACGLIRDILFAQGQEGLERNRRFTPP